MATSRTHYTLGDSALAGDRLALLAEVFGPTSEQLVSAMAPPSPELAIDLGCGPGHTTRLLAETSGAHRTVGIDASANFVARARATHPDLEFLEHDATVTPFPTGPADVVFARYLLTHLPDPEAVVRRWVTQLRSGGRLLLEDVEGIETSVDPFSTYLEISGRMIEHYGASLYVGATLSALTLDDADGAIVSSSQAFVTPSTSVVARLFRMNLATWRHDPWVVENVEAEQIVELDEQLGQLYDASGGEEIRWTHRQVVYERR